MSAFVAYLRVFTQRQGESGLGMAAQQAAVDGFTRHGGAIIATFVEVESGRKCERPQLAAALAQCRETGVRLIVAKLDRLARDVHFISGLMKSGVDFVAADMPQANRLTIHILAAVAEDEARRTSERTKAALAAAKARGVKLGGFRGYIPPAHHRALGVSARQAKARARAERILPLIDDLRVAGVTTNVALAAEPNARGVVAPRGGRWHAIQVSRLLMHAIGM